MDYRNTLFETSNLDKHSGEPTFESIRKAHKTLKANAQDVQTALGGANHGYLGLVMSDLAYSLISGTPLVRPANPGVLNIPAGTTIHMAANMKNAHNESIRLFLECKGIEKALLQQLVEVFDSVYFDALRDASTNSINAPIRNVI